MTLDDVWDPISVALLPNILNYFPEELFVCIRVVCVGVAKVMIFYLITKTFLKYFASLIILVSMTYLLGKCY